MAALNTEVDPPRRAGRVGRAPRLHGATLEALRWLAETYPGASVARLAALLREQTGVVACDLTVRRALRRMGLRAHQPRGQVSPAAGPGTGRGTVEFRYADCHRRQPGPGRLYPSDLTDEEWALAEPVLRPPRFKKPLGPNARRLLDAIIYVARTGVQWRYLPTTYPRWNSVAKQFYRWIARGVFDRLASVLRVHVREREGRPGDPTAAVLDSQSVKTTEKGGSAATTRARRSRAGSAASS